MQTMELMVLLICLSLKSSLQDHSKEISNLTIELIVAGVAGFLLVSSLVGFAVFKIHNRTRRTTRMVGNDLNTQGTSTYTIVNHLSCDNDIEMDTFAHSDETGTIHHNPIPQTEPAAVRSELQPSVQPDQPSHPRAELSHLPSTNNLDGMIYIQLSGGSRDVFCYEKHKDICRCRIDKQCHCKSYDFLEDICIEKSDQYVLDVAASICHDPCTLFYNLGLEYSIIYQENNSRDRDPVKISQKELVINLLNRWIEVKPTQTTLKQLSLALCKADFHDINSKLYDLYIHYNDITMH
ncbi:uncharacterized protein LOC123556252 isoform X2 [Mercenaria mercenaria]|uniref:uncharacterized protein LOC123556252 isoform X2 n=1 Tax=Mercenaria mercenaria TaxID=6596 RepID=UPI00234ED139|nr:uncharacterized protein LOC123556252 isoform X2 [Mercenaria mercenaria]